MSKLNEHHIRPRSRVPDGAEKDDNNIVYWEKRFHERWHQLFWNMTPSEIHEFIDLVSYPDDAWTARRFARLRKKLMEETENTVKLPVGS